MNDRNGLSHLKQATEIVYNGFTVPATYDNSAVAVRTLFDSGTRHPYW
jgi:hypothetical protein